MSRDRPRASRQGSGWFLSALAGFWGEARALISWGLHLHIQQAFRKPEGASEVRGKWNSKFILVQINYEIHVVFQNLHFVEAFWRIFLWMDFNFLLHGNKCSFKFHFPLTCWSPLTHSLDPSLTAMSVSQLSWWRHLHTHQLCPPRKQASAALPRNRPHHLGLRL